MNSREVNGMIEDIIYTVGKNIKRMDRRTEDDFREYLTDLLGTMKRKESKKFKRRLRRELENEEDFKSTKYR